LERFAKLVRDGRQDDRAVVKVHDDRQWLDLGYGSQVHP